MANMRLYQPDSLRIDIDKGFVDLEAIENYSHYSLNIRLYDINCIWALIRTEYTTTSYPQYHIVVFPDENWLNEWLEVKDKVIKKRTILITSMELSKKDKETK